MREWLTISVVLLGVSGTAFAGGESLTLSQNPVLYSKVIQGGQETIDPIAYNLGTGTGTYQLTATYGTNAVSLGGYTGTLPPNTYSENIFPVATGSLTPGTYPVSATLRDTTPGATAPNITSASSFTVLAHAMPAIYYQGKQLQLAPLSTSPAPTSDAFSQAPPAGTEMGGSADAQMLGDPAPDVPTAELDLDSISEFGSPYIVTTLQPFTDLPSDDDPSEGVNFAINVDTTTLGDYDSTFVFTFSDEQDLPGAYAPGSETATLEVNVDLTADMDYWTLTADVPIPEPGGMLIGSVMMVGLGWRVRRPGGNPKLGN